MLRSLLALELRWHINIVEMEMFVLLCMVMVLLTKDRYDFH